MHASLAALAETPSAGTFSSLVQKAKSLVSREEIHKLTILARSFISPLQFSKPADRSEWLARIRANSSYFKKIYALVFAVCLFYTVLSSPLLLVGLAVLASAWVYCFILTDQDAPLTVAGFELRRREKLIALVPFTILVVALCGLINSLIYVIFLSSLCSLPHASFHEVTELDALDVLELEGLKSAVPNV